MFYNDRNEKIVYVGSPDLSEAFSCLLAGVTLPNPDYKMIRRPSREYIFEFVIEGRGWIESEGGVTPVSAGTFYLIRKGAEVSYGADPSAPYEKIWLNADGTLLSRMCSMFSVGPFLTAEANVLDSFLEIHDRLSRMGEGEEADCHAEVLCLLFRILTAATKNTYFPPAAVKNTLDEKIRAWLDANIYSDISLDDAAAEFGVSKMHVIRVFKKRFGITPMQYVIERRIGAAKSLLTGTVMPIKEIASLLRYSNTQHFSASFKSAVGCTPGRFRKSRDE
ncbi:MAG: helix-turn-helix domain-containing protein [Ruminococcaceae bacterium]|jgi:AraC-like DNA-binding protein|nr:helix-turn-helix domain-containing protein [Oscillospiraceae bacterium]